MVHDISLNWSCLRGGAELVICLCLRGYWKHLLQYIDMTNYDEVLQYWFGGDQNENYNEKWFPSVSDGQQKATDKEIFTKFKVTFDEAVSENVSFWKVLNIRSNLAYIIVLDQFSRHIFRYLGLDAEDPQRQLADQLALDSTDFLITRTGWLTELTSTELVFALMPYRHTPSLTRLRYILEMIDRKQEQELNSIDMIARFRKQTILRLQRIIDRTKAEEAGDILERPELNIDESGMGEEALSKATLRFILQQQCTSPIISHAKEKNRSQITMEDCHDNLALPLVQDEPIVISLSGGVDSMVITRILVYLRSRKLIHSSNIVAVHIDYANRVESGQEADYVEQYCLRHGVDFEKRVINEVTRGITDRDQYEKVARQIRYDFYKQVLSSRRGRGVIFGHHRGDVQENVISNVMRGCSPLNLSGMTSVGTVSGVDVWRPLLKHDKDEILAFAHKYGVPYFRDTTPSWSTRGQLRSQLVPLLVNMYGTGCLRNLSMLAEASDELQSVVHERVYEPFLNAVERFPCGLRAPVFAFRDHPLSFWREVLRSLMHSMGLCMVREGGAQCLIDRLNPKFTSPHVSLSCNKKLRKKQELQLVRNQLSSGEYQGAALEGSKSEFRNDSTDGNSGHINNCFAHELDLIPGWIELRKGLYSYLTPSGGLVVFKDQVLWECPQGRPGARRDGVGQSGGKESEISRKKQKQAKREALKSFRQRRREVSNGIENSDNTSAEIELGNLFITCADESGSGDCAHNKSLSTSDKVTSEPGPHSDGSTAHGLDTIPQLPKPWDLRIQIPWPSANLSRDSTAQLESLIAGWSVIVNNFDLTDTDKNLHSTKLFDDPSFLLSGKFDYVVSVPVLPNLASISLVVYAAYRAGTEHVITEESGCEEAELLPVPALSSMDLRTRLCVPLLVPVAKFSAITTAATASVDEKSSKREYFSFRISYTHALTHC